MFDDIYGLIAEIIAVLVVIGSIIGMALLFNYCFKANDIEAWNGDTTKTAEESGSMSRQ